MAQTATVVGEPNSRISPARKVLDLGFWGLCGIAMLLVLAPVIWIVYGVLAKAIPVWKWSVLTEAANGVGGGLLNAIAGTFAIMIGVAIVAGIIGIFGGIYLSEISQGGKVTTVLRSGSEILSGVPSIVFGYCGFVALVSGLHWGYGLLPGVIVVAMLVVPYITKATELALGQVPLAYREGAEALGMSKVYILRKILMRAAIPGVLTGLIIAVAISVGETAPLLYTAGNSTQYPSTSLIHHPIGYLTYLVFTNIEAPQHSLQVLAFDASLVLVVLVLALILTSRLIVRLTQKYSPNRAASSGGRASRSAVRANRAQVVAQKAE
jgi:phosphate transport system permease protein